MATAVVSYSHANPLLQLHQASCNNMHIPLKRLRRPTSSSSTSSSSSSSSSTSSLSTGRPNLALLNLETKSIPSANYSIPALRRVIARLSEANHPTSRNITQPQHIIIPLQSQVSCDNIEKKLNITKTSTSSMFTAVICAAGVVAIGATFLFSPTSFFGA